MDNYIDNHMVLIISIHSYRYKPGHPKRPGHFDMPFVAGTKTSKAISSGCKSTLTLEKSNIWPTCRYTSVYIYIYV